LGWMRGGPRRSRRRVQRGVEWLSIVPIAESRSSYNGLLVFAFMVQSGALAAWAIHRLASDKLRRAPAWDCGYPDANPATWYRSADHENKRPVRKVGTKDAATQVAAKIR
jgi:hydrogenase-4 component B